MKYKDEVIHFIGGLTPFLGELDQGEHPNGPHWYRINRPCLVLIRKIPGTEKAEPEIITMEGDESSYRKYVDIRIPPDSIMEIRTLDKKGKLYEMYDAAIKRIKKSKIHLAGSQDIANIVGAN